MGGSLKAGGFGDGLIELLRAGRRPTRQSPTIINNQSSLIIYKAGIQLLPSLLLPSHFSLIPFNFPSAHRYFIPTAFSYADFALSSAFSKSLSARYAFAKTTSAPFYGGHKSPPTFLKNPLKWRGSSKPSL